MSEPSFDAVRVSSTKVFCFSWKLFVLWLLLLGAGGVNRQECESRAAFSVGFSLIEDYRHLDSYHSRHFKSSTIRSGSRSDNERSSPWLYASAAWLHICLDINCHIVMSLKRRRSRSERPACTQTTMQQQKTLKTLTDREPLMPRHRFVFFGLTSLNVNIHSYRRPEYYSQLFLFRFSSSFVRQDGSRRSCLFVFISGP